MKRDMDLVRAILLKLEEDISLHPKTYNFHFDNSKILVPGHNDEAVYSHLLMLIESPYVEGRRAMSGEITVKSLTWDGREFLDAIRDVEIWGKTKERAKAVAGVGLQFVWEIAKAEIKTKLGLP